MAEKLPSGRWRARWIDEHGKRRSGTFATQRAAEAKERRMRVHLDDVRTGRIAGANTSPRLRDVVPGWLAGRSPERRADDKGRLDRHVIPHFGDWPIDTISPMAVEAFIRKLEQTPAQRRGQKAEAPPLKPNSIKNIIIVLRKLLRDHGHPLSVTYKVGDHGAPWLESPRDVEAFLDECRPRWFRAAAYLSAYAGLRKGEVAGLLWSEIDWRRHFIHVAWTYDGKPVKGKKDRYVPLAPELEEELRLWKKHRTHETDLVINIGGHPITEETDVARPTRRACKRAEVREINFHQVRHTFASHLAEKHSLAVVGAVLGHEDPRTTMRYAHLDTRSLVRNPELHLSYQTPDDPSSDPDDPDET